MVLNFQTKAHTYMNRIAHRKKGTENIKHPYPYGCEAATIKKQKKPKVFSDIKFKNRSHRIYIM